MQFDEGVRHLMGLQGQVERVIRFALTKGSGSSAGPESPRCFPGGKLCWKRRQASSLSNSLELEVLTIPIGPAVRKFYSIAGRFLCVEALDDWSARVADHIFGEFHLGLPSAKQPAQVDQVIKIRSTEQLPVVPSGLSSFEVEGGRCYTNQQTYYLDVDGSMIVVGAQESDGSLSAPTVEVWLGNDPRARENQAVSRVTIYAMDAAMRRCGLYQLHGAGVVDPESGGSALIVGASGSGKSTLTLQLAVSGWLYLTDDTLLISEKNGIVEARGLKKKFGAAETSLRSYNLPRLEESLGNFDALEPGKRRFRPNVLFPDQLASVCVPTAIFFPRVKRDMEDTRSLIRRISQMDAMTRLVRTSPWATYDSSVSRDYLGVLALLSRQAKSYELQAGFDIYNQPDVTATLLTQYVSGAG